MSKIEELIQQYCPKNVDYYLVDDLINSGDVVINSSPIKLKKNEYNKCGIYPVVDQGQEYIIGFVDDINLTLKRDNYIIFGDHTEIFKYVDFAFSQGADGIKILSTNKNRLIAKFLYYALCTFYIPSGKYTRHFSFLKKTEIPIPPLPVQEEIVRILDSFTELKAELKAELEAELEARKMQYEFYRNKLLTPIDDNGKWMMNSEEVEWKMLGEECVVYTGGEAPENSIKGGFPTESLKYPIYGNGIEIYGYTDSYRIDKDSVTISSIGANTGSIYYREAFFTPIIRLKVVIPKKENILSKYLYYYLSSINIYSKKSSVPNMNADDVKKIEFPIPPIAEQERIVSLLDKFDSLVNDISVGLPAEIKARRKQYEYYRNKLLSFKKIES